MPVLLSRENLELANELEIKRSRFITRIRRVSSADQARALVADCRSEFPDARHHCSAFIVSVPGAQPLMHSSDDGEPSGTAGRPMLDVLAGADLTDIAVVVIRYFGGTLLGTGGLVRAYTDAVAGTLAGSRVVRQIPFVRARVSLMHSVAGKVEADLRAGGYDVVGVSYESSRVQLDVAVPDLHSFNATLAQLTSGSSSAIDAGIILSEESAGRL
ncbi:IMPACT family protein [Arcanobacterium canis]